MFVVIQTNISWDVKMRSAAGISLDPSLPGPEVEGFREDLTKRIIGQQDAIDLAVNIYNTALSGLIPRNRPISNVLMLGPTGVGKTRLVEAVAESLFGNSNACIKIDCAEFQHSHEISKLIGSPPGYLGHRETHPMLTQESLNQYHSDKTKISIVLFDEIEKASDSLWQLLLGILDKATLTLGDNRKVNFSQCIIFMTSNLGGAEMIALSQGDSLGFMKTKTNVASSKLTRIAEHAATRKFSPEFINRIDKTIVFKTLTNANIRDILNLELSAVQLRILDTPSCPCFTVVYDDKVKDYLIKQGTDDRFGARHLKRVIEKEIVSSLANLLTSHQIKSYDVIRVSMVDSKIRFHRLPQKMIVTKPELWIEDIKAPVDEILAQGK